MALFLGALFRKKMDQSCSSLNEKNSILSSMFDILVSCVIKKLNFSRKSFIVDYFDHLFFNFNLFCMKLFT